MKNAALPIATLAVLGAAGMSVSGLKDTVQPPVPTAGLDAHETHGSTSLLGQFRTSASSWLWLRADLYLHNGVEMRVLTETELKAGHKGVGTSDQLMGDEMKHVSAIPTKDRDFRGVFGDVERAVSAFKDMKNHSHNDPQQALPLFRLMTWIDPQFIPGWQIGGAVIARGRTEDAVNRALAFLKDGAKNNPNNITLKTEVARLLITRQGKLDEAIELLKDALRIGYKQGEHLSEDEATALEDSFRWLALCYRNTAQFQLMRATALAGLKVFPDDQVLPHLLTVAPSILSDAGAKEWAKRANTTVDTDEVFKSRILEDDHDHEGHDHDGDGHEDHSPEDHDHGHDHDHDHDH